MADLSAPTTLEIALERLLPGAPGGTTQSVTAAAEVVDVGGEGRGNLSEVSAIALDQGWVRLCRAGSR